MHVTPRSGFWSWRELVYWQDNLSAAQRRPPDKEAWERTSVVSPSLVEEAGDNPAGVDAPALSLESLHGYRWTTLAVCQEERITSSAGTHQHPPPVGGEDVSLILLVVSNSIYAKPSGKAPRCPRRQQGRSEPSVGQHQRTKNTLRPPCSLPPKCLPAQTARWYSTEDASEQSSAGQWKVVCCWFSKKLSDALFLIPTYWRRCWGW